MTDKAMALSLSFISMVTPINSTIIANHGEDAIITQAKELARQEEEERVTEEAKLEILEKEARVAEAKIKEKERIASVTVNPYDARVLSHLKTSELRQVFENTPSAKNMVSLAPAFIDAEKIYGVNALVLAGIVALESSWATSRRALDQNNLTGYAVYHDNSTGKDFLSQYDCILETARLLNKDYLQEDGQWHKGYSVKSINTMYSSDENWYNKVSKIGNDFLQEYHNIISEENDVIS